MKLKNTIFIFFFLLVCHLKMFAQTTNIYVNFDDVDMAFSTFSGAQFQKVTNPSKTGINVSNNVGQFTSSSGSTYEGVYNSTAWAQMDLSTLKTFKMKVLSPRTGNIAFKLEYTPNKSVDYISVTMPVTKVGEWEEIYFDFPAAKSNLYDHIVISFDLGDNTHNGEKWYFDDITLTTKPAITTLSLPNVFSNNMVLQQNALITLWGWAPANENVEITAGWGQSVTAKTDTSGKWTTKIQTPGAIAGLATPYSLTFKTTTKTFSLTNILIGDVWICSGQSNMEYTMTPNLPWTRGVLNYSSEIAAANYPNIRLYKVPRNAQALVADNCGGTWLECNPTNVANFSGVAYYFGRELYNNSSVNIPIGLMLTSYGGSSCQAWTSREALAADAELKSKILDPYDSAPTAGNPEYRATNLYNGMIAPLVPFAIKGALWYQGEANASGYALYPKLLGAMIQDWRSRWCSGNFPFYFVQLAPYSATNWANMRDAQTSVLQNSNTGMAITIDIADSDPANIHPENKREIGERLAKWALAKDYGQNLVFSGPVYKSFVIQGNKLIITFHPTTLGSGLTSKDNESLREFEICGADGIFYPANAIIIGNTVEIYSANVSSPVAAQYAFRANPIPNFINKEGLPAAPFKTSTWNNNIEIASFISGFVANPSSVQTCTLNGRKLLIQSDSNAKIAIFDTKGILIHTQDIKQMAEVDISSFLSGIYILRVFNYKNVFSTKFIR